MLRAATQRSFGQCLKSFIFPVSRLPYHLLASVPARLIFCVYLGTYATANLIDTLKSFTRSSAPTDVTASTSKFVGTAVVSTCLTVCKDSRMAQFLGTSGKRLPTPTITYCLFTARDAITIFASFNLPTLIAPRLADLPPAMKHRFGKLLQTESGRFKTAQFLLPAAVQFVTTPIHLLGLDLYNRRDRLSFASRMGRVVKDSGMAVPARMVRIIPAFGMGGVINASTRKTLMGRL